jgi:manganese/zinc/iron transport system substrate-binding protein
MRGFLLVLVALVGCNQADDTQPVRRDSDPQARAMRVVVTTGMIADAAKVIGGEHIRLKTLMGPGVDPHQYKPTPSDIRDLQTAQLVLYNGLHLEGKMTDVLNKPGSKLSVAVTRDLDVKSDVRPAPPGFEGVHDPHVWFDVSLWSKCVGTIGAAMAEVDPAHAADYTKRTKEYQTELAALHTEVLEKVKAVPQERRVLITAHDAFYYFGRAYNFDVHGLQGVSTASEPSTRDVQELAKLIGTRKVSAIFGETSVPDRNLQAVVDAADKDYKVKVKFIAGKLFSDAMGAPDTPEGKYVGMIRHNVNTIVSALKE